MSLRDQLVEYNRSAQEVENEGWFALQDIQVVQDDLPSHVSFN